jgi:hypothetical protein
VATEVGRLDFEAALRAAGPTRRMTIQAELHVLAFAQVWAQADRAGVTEPLALTRFLLERLYPEMRGERLEAIMARFAELKSAGRWDGPRRPEPLTGEGR